MLMHPQIAKSLQPIPQTMPNVPDPFPIYKDGEQRLCYAVDFDAWAAHGWSKDPNAAPAEAAVATPIDPAQPEAPPEPATTPEPADPAAQGTSPEPDAGSADTGKGSSKKKAES